MEQRIKKVLQGVLGVDFAGIPDEAISAEALDDWDSLNHLRLITALEQAFKVKFSMEEVNTMINLSEIRTALENHSAA